MYEIRSDIPIPEQTGSGRKAIYPFRQMKIGDSFVVPSISGRASAYAFAARNKDYRFASVRLEDGKYRIWRTPIIVPASVAGYPRGGTAHVPQ